MRTTYSGMAWRLNDLKSFCNGHIHDILSDYSLFKSNCHDRDETDTVVRYVIDENKFGYATMGNFCFMDDCMYVISDNEIFKEIHNEELPAMLSEWFGVPYKRKERYITRVIFAGVRTPFRDKEGDWIYTGDIVKADGGLISGVCAFPPSDEYEIETPYNYGLMLDNCSQPLRFCTLIERLGTIYFRIDLQETEIPMEKIIGGRAQRLGFDSDFLLCARYTPSFKQKQWEYNGLEIIGAEYDWRK